MVDARYGKPWVRKPSTADIDIGSILQSADRMLAEGIEIFDVIVPMQNGVPDWHRDPKTGADLPKTFGLQIDFRHMPGGVDIKYFWELNRHLWWVVFAQAYAVSDDYKYLLALSRLLDSWLTQCPYPIGPNWSSPVEHGIRLINWSIVWHLIGGEGAPIFDGDKGKELLDRWLVSIYRHQRFISDNYSFYSSADNHLIGEAAGIFVAAHTWDLWIDSRKMRQRAKHILETEILKQFSADGVNLEQAICYHKFSLEFLLASLLCGTVNNDNFSTLYTSRMRLAVEFLASMMDCIGHVPAIGDSDDGKVFEFLGSIGRTPYESLLSVSSVIFDSPALAQKSASLGILASQARFWMVLSDFIPRPSHPAETPILPCIFKQGGYAILGQALHTPAEFRLTMDIGPLGYNRIAGHGHADCLSLLLASQGSEFLVDAGTYCYNAAPEFRHYFRGTAAHNTAMIDNVDQSVYGGSFLWLRDVVTTLHDFSDDGIKLQIEASHDGYMRFRDPVRHFRKVIFDRSKLEVIVEDRFDCALSHHCTLHWHFAPECAISREGLKWLAIRETGTLKIQIEPSLLEVNLVSGRQAPPLGWISRQFYEREPTQVLTASGVINTSSLIRTCFTYTAAITDQSENVTH
ncbi:MAG TPA: alginate lyase family protein [Nitrosospira sp.]|nr:alginate lyase family protein [Nitrosospira sp.]